MNKLKEFQKVYEEFARPVYRFLLSLTGSEDMAEELLAETFYQAFLHIDRFEGRCSLYTWLCQIGKNAWLKECRRNKRYSDVAFEELELADKGQSAEEKAVNADTLNRIRKAIQKLEDTYRDVFVLHAIGEVSLKEIAAIHGKSESWARVTYFRAKNKIAEEVSR
jgi:RNA polymerase sigma-70 factor (ECF subfamily)